MSEKRKREIKESKFGTYYTIPFTRSRDIVVDFIRVGKKTMKVYAIGEIDVTYPLMKIKELKEKGINLSFSAFITYVFARTTAEHPYMQAIKWRRRKMVVFEDVDVTFIVEREVKGKKMPTMVMIRKANEKTIQEITDVLWDTKALTSDDMISAEKKKGADKANALLNMPRFLRRFLFDRIFKNPFLRRQFTGTVGLTSVGMYAGGGGTSIPIAVENLSINVGGIEKRPGYLKKENGEVDISKIIPRDYLWITFNIDHTTVDGAPTARFLAIIRERLRMGYGLDEVKPVKKVKKKAKET
ncbi:MAG: 2-oxo acid dehydrogenase subunit E2 [Candidatus Heimdallarchaeota archaeon]|nr:2-oxo acid dehydrogenase subunit E2 [Candidatus Heimdallarchaeota archaeon]